MQKSTTFASLLFSYNVESMTLCIITLQKNTWNSASNFSAMQFLPPFPMVLPYKLLSTSLAHHTRYWHWLSTMLVTTALQGIIISPLPLNMATTITHHTLGANYNSSPDYSSSTLKPMIQMAESMAEHFHLETLKSLQPNFGHEPV